MLQDNRLLIIGGTGRNVGKTEFVCRLISKIAITQTIYALKVSAIYPDEEIYHGTHEDAEKEHQLFEEIRRDTRKDTSRMLRAGAARVFYLRCDEAGIVPGYQQFRRMIPQEAAVICESNSLGNHVRAALQIVIKGGIVKPRALPRLEQADLVIVSDGSSGFAELARIHYAPSTSWYLSDESQ